MKLVVEWTTPDDLIEKIAQLFYLMATSNRDTLNECLLKLDGQTPPVQKQSVAAEVVNKSELPKVEEEEESIQPEEPEEELTLDMLRKAFVEKNSPENRPKLKAILTKLGVSKITQLEQDQYNEAYALLGAI